MAIQSDSRADLVRMWCERFVDVPTAQLARMIYEARSEAFGNLELARSAVRYFRGQNGKKNRRRVAGSALVQPVKAAGWFPKMPQSKAESWEPFVLGDGRMLVLSDLHIPFHDVRAIETAVEVGRKREVHTVLINGDLGDFYSISKFDKVPNKSRLRNELAAMREFLAWLKVMFPKARIIYKLGNHDEWFDKYIFNKAAELVGVPAMRLQHILTADFSKLQAITSEEREMDLPECWYEEIDGITFVGDGQIIMAGDLPVLHGHEMGRSFAPPVNAARGAFLKALNHVWIGHSHQRSEHSEKTLMGRIITTYSSGCLCGLTPKYARVNKWSHGCGVIEVDGRDFLAENLKIIDGVVY